MSYQLHIIRKNVKNLRIKVVDADTVHAIAPEHLSTEHISSFLKNKSNWIEKQRDKIRESQKKFDVGDFQILLHGEGYTACHLPDQGKKYTIDHRRNLIWRGYDMFHGENQLKRYKTYAKNILPYRLDQLSKHYGIEYDKCFVRDQKTKWGTCSSKGHIGLNWRLIKMPLWIMDYVISHELAHRRHMNHSKDFWDECIRLFPRSLEARKWLRIHGSAFR